jgi:hypothetical protein
MSTFSFHKQYDDSIFYVKLTNRSYSSTNINTVQYTANLGVIKLEDLYKNIIKKDVSHFENITAPYPIAIRAVKDNVYLVERPPFQIKVDYSPTRSGLSRRSIKPVTIWIPWTVTVYDLSTTVHNFLSNYQIHFNDSSLASLDDQIIPAYTSNVYGDGKICLGQSYNRLAELIRDETIDSFASLHSYMFNEYFTGGWNADLSNNLYQSLLTVGSPYLIPNYSDLSESHPIAKRAIDSKIKMFTSKSYIYTTANMYYNLSLLTLEETLDLLKSLKDNNGFPYIKPFPVKSLFKRESPPQIDRLNLTDNHSNNYRTITVRINNTLYDNSGPISFHNTKRIPESILNFFKENSERIIDDIHARYIEQPNSMSISINYEIPISTEEKVEEDAF